MLFLLDKILVLEMNLKNLITRTLSGAVYVALIILGIMTTEWAFITLCAILSFLASREFILMTKPSGSKLNMCFDVLTATLIASSFALFLSSKTMGIGAVCCMFILIYLLTRPIMQLYNKKEDPIKSLAHSFLSLCYIVLPLLAMAVINEVSSTLLLLLFVMIWLNDTGAFLVGCTIGKHRLFERISPKKSWEGFWGGVMFSTVSGIVYYYFIEQSYPLIFFIILGIIVSVLATFGDLVESMFKRSRGIKDSGNLIPGHGGILDRIDSLLFVLPAVVLYLLIFEFCA